MSKPAASDRRHPCEEVFLAYTERMAGQLKGNLGALHCTRAGLWLLAEFPGSRGLVPKLRAIARKHRKK